MSLSKVECGMVAALFAEGFICRVNVRRPAEREKEAHHLVLKNVGERAALGERA